jgi:hypothetical protein
LSQTGPQDPLLRRRPFPLLRALREGREGVSYRGLLLEGEALGGKKVKKKKKKKKRGFCTLPARARKQEEEKLTPLLSFSFLSLSPFPIKKTGGIQPRLHPDPAPLPAEGLRPLPHRLQLRAVEEGREGRHARAAALRPRRRVVPLLLDPRRPRRSARSQGQPVDQGHLGPDGGAVGRRDQDAGEPRVSSINFFRFFFGGGRSFFRGGRGNPFSKLTPLPFFLPSLTKCLILLRTPQAHQVLEGRPHHQRHPARHRGAPAARGGRGPGGRGRRGRQRRERERRREEGARGRRLEAALDSVRGPGEQKMIEIQRGDGEREGERREREGERRESESRETSVFNP